MNNKFQFFRNLFKGNEKDEKEKKISAKFLIILLILGIILMFSSNLFQAKKPEVPVLKSQTEQVKDVPTFGQKNSDNKSNIDKYEKEYEQQLKEALESVTGVKDVTIEINLDSSEEKILDKNTVKRSQTTDETDKEGGKRKVEDESTDEKTVIVRQGDKEAPIILRENKPKVRGVLVVAKGVDNLQVKQMVIEAVSRMLEVPSHRVSVLPKKN
ncbi:MULTISPECIES: stage III sporulation protein AG [unclassified Bacillus (in: firmicutes)]|uniref:stage III sporulation protein AG n=1 Tax=unclassified Bacillus (in: firmicutes) TaxID=185979 RepID=UPI0008E8D618|nr:MULTISPECIES: stage III sporulation protein AG [unclassified Bacillus (in: firmicutes)]SFI49974.1 stage III sporulation protein AG [Bacillus sp. 71mf]SFS48979.1 stage III sporulation protein AG [Bacillus sp. 103mf]